jgi:hypothetical protein
MTCPGRVSLQVLEPIPTAGLSREGARELADRVRGQVVAAMPVEPREIVTAPQTT